MGSPGCSTSVSGYASRRSQQLSSPIDHRLIVNRVLLVGKNGFLAQSLLTAESTYAIHRSISHTELDEEAFSNVKCVVNFATHPDYYRRRYSAEIDFDRQVAELACRHGAHYVMLSSRKVYRPDVALDARETDPTGPADFYGENKLRTEQCLAEMLGENLTVLRLSNVFGYELTPRHGDTFMAQILRGLRQSGEVVFDISPFTRKDILPDIEFARALSRVLERPRPGIYNLGSGVPFPIGQAARWVMDGFGDSKMIVTSSEVKDEYFLNMNKFSNVYQWQFGISMLREYCASLGKRLSNE